MTDTRSQCQKIHALLKTGPATNMHIFRLCGSLRGSARICDLRQRGVEIETEMIKSGGARVAQYKLKGWEPEYVEPEGWTPGWTDAEHKQRRARSNPPGIYREIKT